MKTSSNSVKPEIYSNYFKCRI